MYHENFLKTMSITELELERIDAQRDLLNTEEMLIKKSSPETIFERHKIENTVTIHGKKKNAAKWKNSREAGKIVAEMIADHDFLLSYIYEINEDMICSINEENFKSVCSYFGIDKKAFYICWNLHKMCRFLDYIDKIENIIQEKQSNRE